MPAHDLAKPSSISSGNLQLDALGDTESAHLRPHLERVQLSPGQIIYEPGETIQHIYFPINSIISGLAIMEDGATIETAMMGRDCLTGIEAIMGRGMAMRWTRVMLGGEALRMSAHSLREAFNAHGPVQDVVMSAYRMLVTQVSQRAVCNARHTLTHRFCCWLLMVRDRTDSDKLLLTQETIAGHLGARRASITGAAREMLAMRAIEYRRGHLHITDRTSLEHYACECYSIHKLEFDALASNTRVEAQSPEFGRKKEGTRNSPRQVGAP